ncbi:MAG: AsmA-like C-terminal region-containing protein, partial [Myxococcota bacterium]
RGGLDVAGTRLTLELQDGELVIRQVSGEYETGRVQVGLRVDARPAVPELELAAEVAGVNLSSIASQFQQDTEVAGVLHVSTWLSARGRTVPALRSSVSGRFAVTGREGTIG